MVDHDNLVAMLSVTLTIISVVFTVMMTMNMKKKARRESIVSAMKDEEIDRIRLELTKTNIDHHKHIEELKKEHKDEIDKLKKEHKDETDKLKKEHKDDASNLRKEHRVMTSNLRKHHNDEIIALNDKHTARLNDTVASVASTCKTNMRRLQAQHNTVVQNMHTLYRARVEKLTIQVRMTRNEGTANRVNDAKTFRTLVTDLKTQNTELDHDIMTCIHEIVHLHDEIDRIKTEHEDVVRKLRSEYMVNLYTLRAEYDNRIMERCAEDNERELQAILTDAKLDGLRTLYTEQVYINDAITRDTAAVVTALARRMSASNEA